MSWQPTSVLNNYSFIPVVCCKLQFAWFVGFISPRTLNILVMQLHCFCSVSPYFSLSSESLFTLKILFISLPAKCPKQKSSCVQRLSFLTASDFPTLSSLIQRNGYVSVISGIHVILSNVHFGLCLTSPISSRWHDWTLPVFLRYFWIVLFITTYYADFLPTWLAFLIPHCPLFAYHQIPNVGTSQDSALEFLFISYFVQKQREGQWGRVRNLLSLSSLDILLKVNSFWISESRSVSSLQGDLTDWSIKDTHVVPPPLLLFVISISFTLSLDLLLLKVSWLFAYLLLFSSLKCKLLSMYYLFSEKWPVKHLAYNR